MDKERLRDAEMLCGQILAANPKEVAAIRMLAILAFHGQRPTTAVDLLHQATSLDPQNADLQVDLGNALLMTGQVEKAIAAFRRAITVRPDHVPAHNNLSIALQQADRSDEAIDALAQVVALRPELADRHSALGDLLGKSGRRPEAINAYRAALRIQPKQPRILINLGNLLLESGQVDPAIAALRMAVEHNPDNCEALDRLAAGLRAAGHLEEADATHHKAVTLQSALVETHRQTFDAAVKHDRAGRLREAEAIYRQIIQAAPSHAQAMLMLGVLIGKTGRLLESVEWINRAIAANSRVARYYVSLGDAYRRLERFDLAIQALERAIELQPDLMDAHYNLGIVFHDTGRVEQAVDCFDRVLAGEPNNPLVCDRRLFALQYHPAYDVKKLFEESRQWSQKYADPLRKLIPAHRNAPSSQRPLRIGYVSPDFRDHVVGLNVLPILEHHDHNKFHITCYSNTTLDDMVTDVFRKYADQWRPIAPLGDQEVADCIFRDDIDILVDLALHSAGNRLLVFARKPAPVQVTFAGYPGTTGLSTIDYRLTDPYLDPPGLNDPFYSEQSVRLPHSYWCFAGMQSAPDVNALPALQNGRITFGCLNSLIKLSDVTWKLWAQVLHTVKNSRLLLRAPNGGHRQRFIEKLDVSADRVEFVDYQPRPQYLRTYHRIDIGLDSFPYNGHTTSLDSLWMGVPVVSLCGQTAFSRAGLSQTSNLGLTELVAYTPDEFVTTAVNLANDFPRLSALRATLRQRMVVSPLLDGAGFARCIEEAYQQMWQRWIEAGS